MAPPIREILEMTEGPEKAKVPRRLAAILAADIAGYSALMGADEAATVRDLKAHQAVIHPIVPEHGGRIIDTAGDGVLAEFPSVVSAVECAVAIQRVMAQRNADVEETRRMRFRIGINLGDVVFDDARIYGDGVNVAARLENIAEPGGICISRKVYEDIIGKMQLAFVDAGEQQLKNIAQPVRVYRVSGEYFAAARATAKPVLALPDKPSIAVLPFTNMSGDPEQEYFADGMVEEIIIALSRFPSLFVIARHSSFTYKGRNVEAKQIGRELGVRYLIEGSVRKSGLQLRLTGQLIEASSGMHLWADRFDGSLVDVFGLQDQMTASIVGAIMPRLSHAETERAKRKPTASLDAYDCYMRGLSRFYDDSNESTAEAHQFFCKAIGLDPHYAIAYAAAAMCAEARLRNGWMSDRVREIAEAEGLARRASQLGRDDATALASAGFVLARVVGDLDDGVAFIDQALALNSNLARAWQYSGWVRIWLGEPELAIEHVKRAMRISPVDPALCSMQTAVAFAHFFLGRDIEASSWAAMALRERPNFQPALRIAAASNALAGMMDRAQAAVARLRELNPNLRISNLRANSATQRRSEFSSRYAEGLAKAGLPE